MSEVALTRSAEAIAAPPLSVERWFNADPSLALEDLRGRVVVLHAFQMLCPGCVSHGLPQAQRIQRAFDPDSVAVLGLHTVFEHHEAMTPVSLAAFLHEYRITFPVAVDQAEDGHTAPITMRRYRMRGTPTLILIDGHGRVRHHAFGRPDDLVVGAQVASLVAELGERNTSDDVVLHPESSEDHCSDDVCNA